MSDSSAFSQLVVVIIFSIFCLSFYQWLQGWFTTGHSLPYILLLVDIIWWFHASSDGILCPGFCSMWGPLVFPTCWNCIIKIKSRSNGVSWNCKPSFMYLSKYVMVSFHFLVPTENKVLDCHYCDLCRIQVIQRLGFC